MTNYRKRHFLNKIQTIGCDSKCGCGYTYYAGNMDGAGKEFTSPGEGVENCKTVCNERSGCTGFEYNESGSQNYGCGTYTGGDSNLQGAQVDGWISCVKND